MKVKLLKDHDGNKAGDVIDVALERGNYLIRCDVAIEYYTLDKSKNWVDKPAKPASDINEVSKPKRQGRQKKGKK